jgi:RNA recognition motif-containing protein
MEATNTGDGLVGGGEVDVRKLVILGLPWDTTEASLEQYFSQIGPLQVCYFGRELPSGLARHLHIIMP